MKKFEKVSDLIVIWHEGMTTLLDPEFARLNNLKDNDVIEDYDVFSKIITKHKRFQNKKKSIYKKYKNSPLFKNETKLPTISILWNWKEIGIGINTLFNSKRYKVIIDIQILCLNIFIRLTKRK